MFKNIQNNKVMDVTGGRDAEGQNVQVYRQHGKANQRWNIVYVDSSKDQIKGLNKDFGFYINKPFFIVSRMPMRRAMEIQNNGRMVISTLEKNNKRQIFTFDGKTKTIINGGNSITYGSSNNGRGNNEVWARTTNARWW